MRQGERQGRVHLGEDEVARFLDGIDTDASFQTTVRYTNKLVENLRRCYLRGHPQKNESRRTIDGTYTRGFEALRGRLERAKVKRERRAMKEG